MYLSLSIQRGQTVILCTFADCRRNKKLTNCLVLFFPRSWARARGRERQKPWRAMRGGLLAGRRPAPLGGAGHDGLCVPANTCYTSASRQTRLFCFREVKCLELSRSMFLTKYLKSNHCWLSFEFQFKFFALKANIWSNSLSLVLKWIVLTRDKFVGSFYQLSQYWDPRKTDVW